jgi:NitT/TauT family transport system ATP-binding protein
MLSVEIARKAYPVRGGPGQLEVLRRLTLAIAAGEIVALVGPSGCGKTTLMKIIAGLDTEYEGRVTWAAAAPPAVGVVFQEPRLLPWRTVRENLLLVLPQGRQTASADELLMRLGLWPFRDSYPAQLSLGMARRVAIARAFAVAPEIVLLDEPFVSLDPAMAERSRDVLLEAWAARPTTALIVTHDLVEAASLADRIVMLSSRPARLVADVAVPEPLRRRGSRAVASFAEELRRLRPHERD